MWPFGSRSQHLPEDELERLRKRFRGERKAFQSCLKANGDDALKCRQLEVRLLERYAEQVCPDAAVAYQACYTASLMRSDAVLDTCESEVKKMRECLTRLNIELGK